MNEPVREDQLLAVIEIPMGSRNKYEYDEGLDRVVFDKIVCVPTRDPRWSHIGGLDDVPE